MTEQLKQPVAAASRSKEQLGLTIGSVCRQLRVEFPDISISKIRYLEDRNLVNPHRTPGGYRLYSSKDVARLRTILRVQRDRFLPLNVIRKEIDTGSIKIEGEQETDAGINRIKRQFSFDELVEATGVGVKLVRELEDYGILSAEKMDGKPYYSSDDCEIVLAASELAKFGVAGRNLRQFRSSADRQAALLEQILAPTLKSGNSKRQKQAKESLENLASVVSKLNYLLLLKTLK